MENIKLIKDSFTFADLNVQGLPADFSSIAERAYRGSYYSHPAIFKLNTGFALHKSLEGGAVTCLELISKCDEVISDFDNMVIINSSGEEVPISNIVLNEIKRIKSELEAGFITINNIKIDLPTYETDGEYGIFYTDKTTYIFYRIKKYYSILEGQYTIFSSTGKIKSINGVKSMEISKDVRLTQEELEKLWRS